MAAGLPVVAAAAGGQLETVGRVPDAALLLARGRRACRRLLRSLAQDVDARDTYGQALQATQQRDLTLAAQACATERVYETVL